MRKNFAYSAYKNVESPANFRTERERTGYRKLLMDRARRREVPFFRARFRGGLGKTLEVGSGNGRILYALERAGLIDRALGVEISPSRVAFANGWKKSNGSKLVESIIGDILTTRLRGAGTYDTILCLTSIFPFFDELRRNGLGLFLARAHELLRPGGTLVLESETFAQEIACCELLGGTANLWSEFAKDDPFRFNLMRFEWHSTTRELVASTWYAKRNELFVDGPTTKRFHVQTRKMVEQRLALAGFGAVRVYGDYDSSRYRAGGRRYIFIARRSSRTARPGQ